MSAKSVFSDGNKWFFWDETWTQYFGSFDSEEQATIACQEYGEFLSTGVAARFYQDQEWRDGEELKPKNANSDTCVWSECENGPWSTECKRDFEINDGTPSENEMKFCCFCGKTLEEVPFDYEMEVGEEEF